MVQKTIKINSVTKLVFVVILCFQTFRFSTYHSTKKFAAPSCQLSSWYLESIQIFIQRLLTGWASDRLRLVQSHDAFSPCELFPLISTKHCFFPHAPPSHSATSSCLQIITKPPPKAGVPTPEQFHYLIKKFPRTLLS